MGPEAIEIAPGSDHAPEHLNLRSAAIWATTAVIFFAVPATVFVQSFLALYLHETFKVSQDALKGYLWQPFLATDLGQLAGGGASYLLIRSGWRYLSARRLIMIVGFVGAASLVRMNGSPDVQAAVWWLNVSRFFFQSGYTLVLVYGIEAVMEHQTALMSGTMNATYSACNFLFSPLIGWMAVHFGSYGPVVTMVGLSPLVGLAAWVALSQWHAVRCERAGLASATS